MSQFLGKNAKIPEDNTNIQNTRKKPKTNLQESCQNRGTFLSAPEG